MSELFELEEAGGRSINTCFDDAGGGGGGGAFELALEGGGGGAGLLIEIGLLLLLPLEGTEEGTGGGENVGRPLPDVSFVFFTGTGGGAIRGIESRNDASKLGTGGGALQEVGISSSSSCTFTSWSANGLVFFTGPELDFREEAAPLILGLFI
jgi:hypothetical protein